MTELRIETVNINSLTPDPANARKHDGKNLKAIASSLEKFGQRKPIVVTPDSIVVAGNGTVEAAKSLGWTEIAIARTPVGWTWDQIKAFALADNRTAELAEWDDKVLADQLLELDANGWELEELGFENLEPPLGQDDDDEPLSFDDAPTRAKLGDHWVIGNHHLICGDSLDANTYRNINADVIYTDPPYGISVVKSGMVGADFGVAKKGTYSEVIGDQTGTTAADAFALLMNLYPKAKHIWWGANHFANTASLPNSSCWLVWDKRSDSGIVNTFADAELAWTNLTQPVRVHHQLWNGMIREGEHEKRVHPTQKPVALAEWAFTQATKEKQVIILDAFAGSGSTLIACEKSGQIGYGVELDPKYVDVILDRLEKLTGLEAQLLED
jgi:16S rRNA G966 N2-methylase RsmD